MIRAIWSLVAVLTVLRLFGSLILPLTGDEAYYWEWSRRLAFGYLDHPGGVAWTIAAFRFVGESAALIRFGFWLCGCIATLAVADCARRLAQAQGLDARRAAAHAALLATSVPMSVIAFGTASPDGPFLAAWALALDCAVIAVQRGGAWPIIATGVSVGLALESRAFGVALLFGILAAMRKNIKSCVSVFAVAMVCCVPLLYWNATHAWSMIVFTLFGRHVDEGFSLVRPFLMAAEIVLAFGIGPAVAVIDAAVIGITRKTIAGVLVWTSLPLAAVLLLIACKERIETYWFLGPYLSLAVAAAVTSVAAPDVRRRIIRPLVLVPALALLGVLYALIFASAPIAHAINTQFHARLHRAGPYAIYATADLARDAKRVAAARNAIVFSDGYGLSSLLDFYAGVPPIVIGYSWQGRELRHWYTQAPPGTDGLFVDMALLHDRPDFTAQLTAACGRVEAGPVFRYRKGDLPDMIFPSTWCLAMKPNAIRVLRWEKP